MLGSYSLFLIAMDTIKSWAVCLCVMPYTGIRFTCVESYVSLNAFTVALYVKFMFHCGQFKCFIKSNNLFISVYVLLPYFSIRLLNAFLDESVYNINIIDVGSRECARYLFLNQE